MSSTKFVGFFFWGGGGEQKTKMAATANPSTKVAHCTQVHDMWSSCYSSNMTIPIQFTVIEYLCYVNSTAFSAPHLAEFCGLLSYDWVFTTCRLLFILNSYKMEVRTWSYFVFFVFSGHKHRRGQYCDTGFLHERRS